MSDDAPVLLRAQSGGVVTLTLNRPARHNALNSALFAEIDAACAMLEEAADHVGCVVLRADGRSFCAGADLEEIEQVAAVDTASRPRIVNRLAALPQIVVAQVQGLCVTGGLELALAADIIAAGKKASFADTHGRFGLVALWGMSQRLPRRIGLSQAKLMTATARRIDADEAHRIGLADLLFEDDTLDAGVADLANTIAGNSAHTNREMKRRLFATDGLSLEAGLNYEFAHYPGRAPDYLDRIAAFTQRAR